MTEEPDSWEELEQLTLQPVNKPEPENEAETTVEVDAVSEPTKEEEGEEGASLDQALKEALKNPRERASVLRIEADVAKFVSDKTRCTIEFASDLSSYQVRVFDVKDIYRPPEAEKTSSTPDVVIKRRQGAALGRLAPDGSTQGGQEGTIGGPRSVKQREEEYKAARERILGPEQRTENQNQDSMTESEEDSKSRKAVFRDRIKEQQDPDYRRGSNRFQTPLVYEPSPFGDAGSKTGPPGVYNVPTYTSEFPALPGPRLQPPQFPPMPYPSPPPAGYGFPPRALPFRLPTTGAVPPPWSARPRVANLPPATSPAMMNPAMFAVPSPGFPGYPPGYPMPPRGAYFQPPGATQGQEGETGSGPVPQVRTLRRKPMPPPPATDENIQKL